MMSPGFNLETEASDRDGPTPFGYRDLKADTLDLEESPRMFPIDLTVTAHSDTTKVIIPGRTLKNLRFITGEDSNDDPE